MKIKTSDYIILVILFIVIVSFIEIKYFSHKSETILLDYSSNKITNIINEIINESINNKIYRYKYNDIIKIDGQNNENITSIDFDNEIVNSMLYMVSDEILGKIKLLESNNYDNLNLKYISSNDKVYYVPYGVIYGSSILSNLGPKIPFKISLVGSTNNETKINIDEYGINSSKVEVVLNINFKMMVLLPFKSKEIVINKTIILDSKIIQGKVPDYYGGMFSINWIEY